MWSHAAGPVPSTATSNSLAGSGRHRGHAQLAENMRPSRSRGGRPRRTVDNHEIDAWIERLCRLEGEERLTEYRRQAERLGPRLGVEADRVAALGRKIGAAIGSQQIPTSNRALAARQAGLPFDPDRIERFDALVVALRSAAPQSRHGLAPDSGPFAVQAFWEAYFSNYIEGTTFTVEEAKSIVLDGAVVANRTEDSHDILGTYAIVADSEMRRPAEDPDEFFGLLQARHATLMGGRPAMAGALKTLPNQVGLTLFVDPALVEGTCAKAGAGSPSWTLPRNAPCTRCSSSRRSTHSPTATAASPA